MGRRRIWRRAICGSATVLAAAGLVALGPVHSAHADTTIDQITGVGDTPSKITVRWSDGLLGADNTDVVSKRPDASSPLGFMRSDFENLAVTVSQTQSLVHQGIRVSWTGGKPTKGATAGNFFANFLQIMQCWGDENAGPDPDNCEFGSGANLINHNGSLTSRNGNTCESHTPSVDNPPPVAGSISPVLGCDPAEPRTDPTRPKLPSHVPRNGDQTSYVVPFVPADDPTHPDYLNPPADQFSQFNTNEVQGVATRPDGTGEIVFQVNTAVESPGLGCGETESNGRIRDCWLVVVPRGLYEPNGWKVSSSEQNTGLPDQILESPLGATSWSQRIQIHLGFLPIEPACAIGSADERQTVGTELVGRAMSSWQFAMNSQARCRIIYGYSPTSESAATSQVASSTGTGLAFTTIPIGSEVTRDGNTPGEQPPIAYAPVAVTAISFGFHINLRNGTVTTPVKITPRLLAKALTESYKNDLAESCCNGIIPTWAQNNPLTMDRDPEFAALNPTIVDPASGNVRAGGAPEAPLVTVDRSAINQQVWAWIQSDPTARAWLSGKADENGMQVNPYFKNLNLDRPPAIDSYPRNGDDCYNTGKPGELAKGRCALQMWPYSTSLDDAASHVGNGNNPEGADWDPAGQNPDGTLGWWQQGSLEAVGQTLMWAVAGTSSVANYGLVPAALCAADGTHCITPSDASVSNALATAKPDSAGLLHVNPAAPGTNAYPLVDVIYAAVRATQDPAALLDYASLIGFAVNQGQNPGIQPGQLPFGYLPLPQNLRTAGNAIAGLLADLARRLALEALNPSNNGDNGGGGTYPNNNLGGGVQSLPNPGAAPAPAAPSASIQPYTTTQASAVPAAKNTTAPPLGAVRWTLFVVVIAGIAGSVGGPLLRFVLSRSVP
jgi:hypothetical protein